MTYTVVSESNLSTLENRVNTLILKGYQPLGGIAIKFAYRTTGDNVQSYFQARVLYESTTTR